MQYRFNTPQRTTLNRINIENEPTRHYHQSHQHQSNRYDSIIDYRSKAYQLMQTVTDLQIKDKESNRTIFYLQRQLEVIHKNLEEFLSDFGVSSLAQVKSKYIQLAEGLTQIKRENQRPLIKDEKVTQEYEKILSEYKAIIKCQQEKMLKYQTKWKVEESKLLQKCEHLTQKQQSLTKRLQEMEAKNQKQIEEQKQAMTEKHKGQISKLESQISKLKQQLSSQNKEEDQKNKENAKKMFSENMEMKQDLDMLKTEFRELLIEVLIDQPQKQTIEEKHEKLKKKYKNQIQHFEMIEKQVEEKLIEVEKEITFYKEERELNLQQIQKLQYQNQALQQGSQQIKEEFSFGGYCNTETQTQQSALESDVPMNAECYEISIKSLLEENTRLKRTLVLLDKAKRGEEIPAEAQLELKLLKGLTEPGNLRSRRAQRDSESPKSPKFRVLQGLEKDPTEENQ